MYNNIILVHSLMFCYWKNCTPRKLTALVDLMIVTSRHESSIFSHWRHAISKSDAADVSRSAEFVQVKDSKFLVLSLILLGLVQFRCVINLLNLTR